MPFMGIAQVLLLIVFHRFSPSALTISDIDASTHAAKKWAELLFNRNRLNGIDGGPGISIGTDAKGGSPFYSFL
jgi:hypothetical protein